MWSVKTNHRFQSHVGPIRRRPIYKRPFPAAGLSGGVALTVDGGLAGSILRRLLAKVDFILWSEIEEVVSG